jgi:hypothetical protein
MDFTIVGELTGVEAIAKGRSIRRLKILMKRYGGKNWRKMKGSQPFGPRTARSDGPNSIGTRHTASAARDGRSSDSSTD